MHTHEQRLLVTVEEGVQTDASNQGKEDMSGFCENQEAAYRSRRGIDALEGLSPDVFQEGTSLKEQCPTRSMTTLLEDGPRLIARSDVIPTADRVIASIPREKHKAWTEELNGKQGVKAWCISK